MLLSDNFDLCISLSSGIYHETIIENCQKVIFFIKSLKLSMIDEVIEYFGNY